MTVFEETFQEIDSFGKTFDETANKIRVLTEYVVSDYNVDVASVKLEQKKDDTITDAQVSESLYEVTEKCNGKLKKTMGSINRNSQDYFSKMNASLQKITNDPSYQETIDKAGALCKEFPKLGKVEVTYNAYEEEAKAIAKGMDQLQTVISKGKARKNFTDADSAKIDEIINATNKARQAAGKKDNTVTLTEGVALLSALLIALKNQTAEKATEKTEGPVEAMTPESSRIMLKAIGAQKQLAKSNVAVNTRGALSLRNGIKKAIKQKKSLEKAEAKAAKETKESAEEYLDGDFSFESTDEDMVSDLDAADLLESVFEELHTEPTEKPEEVTESAEDLESSIQDHLSYMSQLENEILGYESATTEESPAEDDIDRILTEAASDVEKALAHSDPGDTDGPTAKEAAEDDEEEPEEPTEESVQESEETITEGFLDNAKNKVHQMTPAGKKEAQEKAEAEKKKEADELHNRLDRAHQEGIKQDENRAFAAEQAKGCHSMIADANAKLKAGQTSVALIGLRKANQQAKGVLPKNVLNEFLSAPDVAGLARSIANTYIKEAKSYMQKHDYRSAKMSLGHAREAIQMAAPSKVSDLISTVNGMLDACNTPDTDKKPTNESVIDEAVQESYVSDEFDVDAMLDQAALESGITQEPETEEEPVEEFTEDLFDIDAMLTEAALSAGITPDSDEVDALCKKYGVTIESSDDDEEEE